MFASIQEENDAKQQAEKEQLQQYIAVAIANPTVAASRVKEVSTEIIKKELKSCINEFARISRLKDKQLETQLPFQFDFDLKSLDSFSGLTANPDAKDGSFVPFEFKFEAPTTSVTTDSTTNTAGITDTRDTTSTSIASITNTDDTTIFTTFPAAFNTTDETTINPIKSIKPKFKSTYSSDFIEGEGGMNKTSESFAKAIRQAEIKSKNETKMDEGKLDELLVLFECTSLSPYSENSQIPFVPKYAFVNDKFNQVLRCDECKTLPILAPRTTAKTFTFCRSCMNSMSEKEFNAKLYILKADVRLGLHPVSPVSPVSTAFKSLGKYTVEKKDIQAVKPMRVYGTTPIRTTWMNFIMSTQVYCTARDGDGNGSGSGANDRFMFVEPTKGDPETLESKESKESIQFRGGGGCKWRGTLSEYIHSHQFNDCPHRKVTCKWCNKIYPFSKMWKHLTELVGIDSCMMRPRKCMFCNKGHQNDQIINSNSYGGDRVQKSEFNLFMETNDNEQVERVFKAIQAEAGNFYLKGINSYAIFKSYKNAEPGRGADVTVSPKTIDEKKGDIKAYALQKASDSVTKQVTETGTAPSPNSVLMVNITNTDEDDDDKDAETAKKSSDGSFVTGEFKTNKKKTGQVSYGTGINKTVDNNDNDGDSDSDSDDNHDGHDKKEKATGKPREKTVMFVEQYLKHLAKAHGNLTTTCNTCGFTFLLSDYVVHIHECETMHISCPFQVHGCPYHGPRRDLNKHINDVNILAMHLSFVTETLQRQHKRYGLFTFLLHQSGLSIIAKKACPTAISSSHLDIAFRPVKSNGPDLCSNPFICWFKSDYYMCGDGRHLCFHPTIAGKKYKIIDAGGYNVEFDDDGYIVKDPYCPDFDADSYYDVINDDNDDDTKHRDGDGDRNGDRDGDKDEQDQQEKIEKKDRESKHGPPSFGCEFKYYGCTFKYNTTSELRRHHSDPTCIAGHLALIIETIQQHTNEFNKYLDEYGNTCEYIDLSEFPDDGPLLQLRTTVTLRDYWNGTRGLTTLTPLTPF